MARKVSLWIVIALVGALAATTAAVVVLASDDDPGGRASAGPPTGEAWPHGWSDGQDGRAVPMMGDLRGEWGGHDAPVLPWVLFALASGTAVGLLVAWSPWHATPAPATTSPMAGGEELAAAAPGAQTAASSIDVTAGIAAQPTTAGESVTAAVVEAEETIDFATETTAEAAEAVAPEAGATEEAPPAS